MPPLHSGGTAVRLAHRVVTARAVAVGDDGPYVLHEDLP